ncbi:hypothetical protein [Synechococcus sp. PCC 7336]|uniref:hypothetical protein n=1 Tax=Synechococcus sp. PCC 7336 TaxID=195250 RepID=UPI00034DE20C|nr:hypothetical protein [Synechococcus sp. PCC 7336]
MSSQQGKGCCFWGCLSLFVLLLLGGGCTAFVGYRTIALFTDARPTLSIPKTEVTDAEVNEQNRRWQAFQQAIAADRPAELVLTARDLNVLVSQSPELAEQIFFEIENNLLVASGNVRVFQLPLLGDRYFNGRLVLDVAIDNGVLDLGMEDFELADDTLPPELKEAILAGFEQQNALDDLLADTDLPELAARVKRLEIRDDRIVLTH